VLYWIGLVQLFGSQIPQLFVAQLYSPELFVGIFHFIALLCSWMKKGALWSFLSSSLGIAGFRSQRAVLVPFLMPSSSNPHEFDYVGCTSSETP